MIFSVFSLNFCRQGIIKGSEKSLEFPNHALDRATYENLTNGNYSLFEAYQKLKRERRERDLADRCIFSAYVHPMTDLIQIQDTRPSGRDKGEWA